MKRLILFVLLALLAVEATSGVGVPRRIRRRRRGCKENERLVECPSPCDPELTCATYFSGFLPLCPIVIGGVNCTSACQCEAGYVRIDGDCVPPEQCCADDPNSELSSDYNPCPGGTCANPEFVSCEAPLQMYGCRCKAGHLREVDRTSKCIAIEACPSTE